METILRGTQKSVIISPERRTVLIGERINPTGRKRLTAALAEGNLEMVRKEADAQVQAGAAVVDVNVSVAGADEVDLLPRAVRIVMETVDVPVSIDSTNAEALRAALQVHRELAPQGRPIINSVSGEEARLHSVLPLVTAYNAAVIGLTMDGGGIPGTPKGRLGVARKIVALAERMGVPREDINIDCLALPIGVDSQSGQVALAAIRMVRDELGVNLTLGVGASSFGLPRRAVINHAYLTMAIQNGVNCPIVDVARARQAVLAADLLLGRDEHSARFLADYRDGEKTTNEGASCPFEAATGGHRSARGQ